jgi:excisionase family DNA binding protein
LVEISRLAADPGDHFAMGKKDNLGADSMQSPNLSRSQQEFVSAIQQLAQRTGGQAGKLISDFLEGLLLLTLVDKVRGIAGPFEAGPPPADKLLTAQEVANLLSVSKAKAHQMMQRGEIASVRMGRAVRVRRRDLDDFLQSRLA